MQWHLNDLSLTGQFATVQDFCAALAELLKVRAKQPVLKDRLFCSRQLSYRQVTPTQTLQQAVLQHPNPLFKRQVLEWIGKSGPFWEDSREPNPNDYFEFQGEDITEQGLGEAARRNVAGITAAAFSFANSRFEFESTPLQVQHGWREPELDFGLVEIPNFWDATALAMAVEVSKPEPCNWREVVTLIRQQFSGLVFAEESIEQVLRTETFSRYVAQRIFELLAILQKLVDESDAQGKLSQTGEELINAHFVGEKAWFSDSSTAEKNAPKFKRDLSFRDPSDISKTLFCTWHGKIKTPQYRIHFEWPRPQEQREIKVVYIGPKLTKK
jgi:hypothetical protein